MKRVAIGGLHTECSSYSPLEQTEADFTRTEREDLVAMVPVDFRALGIAPVPLLHDRSVPGGPVSAATFVAQRAALLDRLGVALPLDGVLLLMHGAMFVPGVEDPEGAILSDIRGIVGPDCLIAAAFDLHGQMTDAIADVLDIFAAYRTAPHVDVPETRARAARMLARALAGGPRPRIHWRRVPLLVPGEMSSTFVEPCASLYANLPRHEGSGVWDANLMIGYVWADSPRATAAAVVTATDAAAGEAAAGSIAAAYWNARERLALDMEALPLDAALDRSLAATPAILADSGDNPTAGGVGDRGDVLAALIARGARGAVIAGIADPVAFASLAQAVREVETGGSLGGGGPRVRLAADAVRIAGDCAVLEAAGLTIVLTERRRPFHDLADFARLGIDLDAVPLLVVKSGYLSPDLRTLRRTQVMALTDGAVSQDLAQLPNHHRPRPTWPFQR